MRLGATLVHFADAPPFETVPWAQRLEAAGFESLWTSHVIGRATFVPDPFVTLAAAAAVTREVEIGSATVQVPLFHPADLAHRVRSLQAVCGDRLTLGVSPGSTDLDFRLLDRDHATRFRVFRENVARLRTLLPDPPDLLLGTWGHNVERAATEFGGWLVSGHRVSDDAMVAALERFRAAGGRRAVVCTLPVGRDLDATAARIRTLADAGFDDAVLLFEPGGPGPEEARTLLPRAAV
ncbi:LLM class flavin-dependent oxidoreductase [Jatrophihabitans sp. YIM 134969]